MKLIVAVNNKGYIGKDGKLMWKCREDLQHFKKLTHGDQLIMGRTTFEKCLGGKPLPNRFHNVVTSEKGLVAPVDEPINYGTLYQLVEAAVIGRYTSGTGSNIWVAGGAEIYRELVHLCDEVHLSIIDDDQEGDAKFELPENYRGEVFIYNFKPDGEADKTTEASKGNALA